MQRLTLSTLSSFVVFVLGAAPSAAQVESSPNRADRTRADGAAPAAVETEELASTWTVRVDFDRAKHLEALSDLAEWRSSGDHAAFRARHGVILEALEPSLSPVRERAAEIGLEVVASTWLVPSLTVQGPESAVDKLRDHAAVLCASRASLRAPNQAEANTAHGLDLLHATNLPTGPIQGTGVTIAMLDSGVDLDMGGSGRPHAAFFPNGDPSQTTFGIGGSRVIDSQTTGIGSSSCLGQPVGEDLTGHGTRMAAIAAGAAWQGPAGAANGAAPASWIKNVRITLCGSPFTTTPSMAQGINVAAADPLVRVANLSYDGSVDPTDIDGLNAALDLAEAAGVSISLSAGNSGEATSFMHGNFGGLRVGSSFAIQPQPYLFPGFQTSAIGPHPDGRRYPDLIAVGEQITTAELDNEAGTIDTYGTSGAAALVSGTSALIYQVNPILSPLEVKALILNTTRPVVAGDPAAAGLGFLDAKAAVDAARADESTEFALGAGERLQLNQTFTAGDPIRVAVVWPRIGATASLGFLADEISDLDLELIDPSGAVVARSDSPVDNVEQIDTVAQTTGLYQLNVRLRAALYDSAVTVALAGVFSNASTTADPQTGPTPVIESVQPAQIDSSGTYARFFIKGEGLENVQAVRVAGVTADYAYQAPGRLRVRLPLDTPDGANTVELVTASGVVTEAITVGNSVPFLSAPPNAFSHLFWQFFAEPNQAFGVFVSDDPFPTFIPGVIDLSIGGGGGSLFLVQQGTLNSGGKTSGNVDVSGLPSGTTLLFQGVVFDLDSLSLVPSNATETLVL